MKDFKKAWIYYIPILGFILFVYKSERYDYKNREILSRPPIDYIGSSSTSELLFIMTHIIVFAITLCEATVRILLE